MLDKIDMRGKCAIVTGAASGLGRAVALRLAEAGADLLIADIHDERLKETTAAIEASGGSVEAFTGDISAAETCRAIVDRAVARFGRLDALCNVAGIIYFTKAPEMAQAQWDRTIAVNLSGPFFLMQGAIPHLLETHGAIVNVTSSAAFVGQAYTAAYCASKAGLTHMTKALAMEYVRQPIRINAVAPGGMYTNIAENSAFPADADMDLLHRFFGLRGVVEVDEVASLVAYLASPSAQAYHGACINIDAGMTAG